LGDDGHAIGDYTQAIQIMDLSICSLWTAVLFQKTFSLAVFGQQFLDQASERSVTRLRSLFRGGFQARVNAQIDLRSFHLFWHV